MLQCIISDRKEIKEQGGNVSSLRNKLNFHLSEFKGHYQNSRLSKIGSSSRKISRTKQSDKGAQPGFSGIIANGPPEV